MMSRWKRLSNACATGLLGLLIICGITAATLNSCKQATIQTVETHLQRHKALMQVAVTIGVGRFLTEHPEQALLVWQVAHASGRAVKAGTIDLTQVVPTIQASLEREAQLDPDLRLLLQALVQAIALEVQVYLDQARLPAEMMPVLVSEVLFWVEQTALMKLGGKVPV